MRIATILFFLFLAVSPVRVFAADPPLPEPLKELSRQGAVLRYLGHDGGMDGWVTFKNGQEQYFYVTPDQQNIMLGVLYNNKGDLITLRQINALRQKDPSVDQFTGGTQNAAPAPTTDMAAAPVPVETASASADKKEPGGKAQQLFADMQGASWIALGQKDAPVIYTIIDPQCPHCHDMIQDARKSGYLEKGQLQLRVIPVGLMNESSLAQAANLLADPNPAAALYKHLDGDKAALAKDPNANTQGVQRNMALMQSWKLDVTPFTVYKNKNGEIKILRGRPTDLKSLVADLK